MMVLLSCVYGLGYWIEASRTPPRARIIFARDSEDMPPFMVDSRHAVYDAFFTKQNAVPTKER